MNILIFASFFIGIDTKYDISISKIFPTINIGYSTRYTDIETGVYTSYTNMLF